jgi:hypothetical protein
MAPIDESALDAVARAAEQEEPVFEAIVGDLNKPAAHLKIYASGRTEGFDSKLSPWCYLPRIIVNRIPGRIRQAEAEAVADYRGDLRA